MLYKMSFNEILQKEKVQQSEKKTRLNQIYFFG